MLENNNDNYTNDSVELFSLSNGFIASKSDECSKLIEHLLEDGILWEFLSALINSYTDKDDLSSILRSLNVQPKIEKHKDEELDEVKQEFSKSLQQVLSEVQGLRDLISTGTLIPSASPNITQTSVSSGNTESTVTRSKVRKNTGGGSAKGGFAAKASKIQGLTRK